MNCKTCQKTLVKKQKSFCSRVCLHLGQQVRVKVDCSLCKKSFTKTPTRVSYSKNHFCSKLCQNKFLVGKPSPKNTQIEVRCLECKKDFTIQKYRQDEAKFCSRKCGYSFRDMGLSTENDKIRHSVAYKIWRTAVFERDDYTCQNCNEKGGYLNADHIKPFSLYPDLRFELNNGRTLCVPCHKATDTFGRKSIYRNVLAVARLA